MREMDPFSTTFSVVTLEVLPSLRLVLHKERPLIIHTHALRRKSLLLLQESSCFFDPQLSLYDVSLYLRPTFGLEGSSFSALHSKFGGEMEAEDEGAAHRQQKEEVTPWRPPQVPFCPAAALDDDRAAAAGEPPPPEASLLRLLRLKIHRLRPDSLLVRPLRAESKGIVNAMDYAKGARSSNFHRL